MARTPRTHAPVADAIDPTLDQEKLNGAMVQMRKDATQEQLERDACISRLAQLVGANNMASMMGKFSAAAEIQTFRQIRESNDFKYLALPDQQGVLRRAETLAEFCPLAFGRTYSSMAEAEQNLQALGEETYDLAARLGLNRSALRVARTLPPEKIELVRAAIANGSSKAEVLSVIEDLAAKVEEATQAATDAKAEAEAKDQLLADKNKRIDQLKAAQKRIAKLPADEALAELQREATAIMNDALGAIRGGLRMALIAVRNHGDDDQSVFMAGLVGQVQADLAALRDEFSLPDVSNAADMALAADMAQWNKK